MPLSIFRQEVEEAQRVLVMYEAVLNRDEKTALSFVPPEEVANLQSMGRTSVELGRIALEYVLFASSKVSSVVQDFCVPELIPRREDSLGVKSSWYFYNLLGAM